jgi:hypothetical protein
MVICPARVSSSQLACGVCGDPLRNSLLHAGDQRLASSSRTSGAARRLVVFPAS